MHGTHAPRDQSLRAAGLRPRARIYGSRDRLRRAGRVFCAFGRARSNDHQVLAIGSVPCAPPISGTHEPGVFVYRTIEDPGRRGPADRGSAEGDRQREDPTPRAVHWHGGEEHEREEQRKTHRGAHQHMRARQCDQQEHERGEQSRVAPSSSSGFASVRRQDIIDSETIDSAPGSAPAVALRLVAVGLDDWCQF